MILVSGSDCSTSLVKGCTELMSTSSGEGTEGQQAGGQRLGHPKAAKGSGTEPGSRGQERGGKGRPRGGGAADRRLGAPPRSR